jgi:hypothetical protein
MWYVGVRVFQSYAEVFVHGEMLVILGFDHSDVISIHSGYQDGQVGENLRGGKGKLACRSPPRWSGKPATGKPLFGSVQAV